MEKENQIARIVMRALAIIIVVAIAYFGIIPFIFGGKKMKSFCGRISPGMKSSEIILLAEKENYTIIERKEAGKQYITIADARAMGRFVCEISLYKEAAVEARYVHND